MFLAGFPDGVFQICTYSIVGPCELTHATCRENIHLRRKIMNLEKEVQLWQLSQSQKARENTQLVSKLRSFQKAVVDLESSITATSGHHDQCQGAERRDIRNEGTRITKV